jgi:hypothetical protein
MREPECGNRKEQSKMKREGWKRKNDEEDERKMMQEKKKKTTATKQPKVRIDDGWKSGCQKTPTVVIRRDNNLTTQLVHD